MYIIEIIAVIVGILGGVVGFISALYPICKSRVNLKIVLPKRKAIVYWDEVEYTAFDIDTLKDVFSIKFDLTFEADIGILNLSTSPQVVYAINLIFKKPDKSEYTFDLDIRNYKSHRVKEKRGEMPLEIKANSAKLISVRFNLEGHDFSDEDIENGSFTIVAYCQNKPFSHEIDHVETYLKIE